MSRINAWLRLMKRKWLRFNEPILDSYYYQYCDFELTDFENRPFIPNIQNGLENNSEIPFSDLSDETIFSKPKLNSMPVIKTYRSGKQQNRSNDIIRPKVKEAPTTEEWWSNWC